MGEDDYYTNYVEEGYKAKKTHTPHLDPEGVFVCVLVC